MNNVERILKSSRIGINHKWKKLSHEKIAPTQKRCNGKVGGEKALSSAA